MERSNLPVNVGRLKKWREDGSRALRCDLPFQRSSGAWTAFAKSSLIWSVITDSYIPHPCQYCHREPEKGTL